MLQQLFGAELDFWVRLAISVVVIAVLLGATILVIRRLGGGSGRMTGRGRAGPRLAVVDAISIDPRRRLVLVRRDDVEHLLLTGGTNDVVVEPNITGGYVDTSGLRPALPMERQGRSAAAATPAVAAPDVGASLPLRAEAPALPAAHADALTAAVAAAVALPLDDTIDTDRHRRPVLPREPALAAPAADETGPARREAHAREMRAGHGAAPQVAAPAIAATEKPVPEKPAVAEAPAAAASPRGAAAAILVNLKRHHDRAASLTKTLPNLSGKEREATEAQIRKINRRAEQLAQEAEDAIAAEAADDGVAAEKAAAEKVVAEKAAAEKAAAEKAAAEKAAAEKAAAEKAAAEKAAAEKVAAERALQDQIVMDMEAALRDAEVTPRAPAQDPRPTLRPAARLETPETPRTAPAVEPRLKEMAQRLDAALARPIDSRPAEDKLHLSLSDLLEDIEGSVASAARQERQQTSEPQRRLFGTPREPVAAPPERPRAGLFGRRPRLPGTEETGHTAPAPEGTSAQPAPVGESRPRELPRFSRAAGELTPPERPARGYAPVDPMREPTPVRPAREPLFTARRATPAALSAPPVVTPEPKASAEEPDFLDDFDAEMASLLGRTPPRER